MKQISLEITLLVGGLLLRETRQGSSRGTNSKRWRWEVGGGNHYTVGGGCHGRLGREAVGTTSERWRWEGNDKNGR